jgi:hypothetical protein
LAGGEGKGGNQQDVDRQPKVLLHFSLLLKDTNLGDQADPKILDCVMWVIGLCSFAGNHLLCDDYYSISGHAQAAGKE